MPDKLEIVHIGKDFKGGSDGIRFSETPPVIQKIRDKKKALRYRNVQDKSTRFVQLQVSHSQITHDEPSNAELIDIDPQFAIPTHLFVTGVLHILLGSVSLSISMVLYFANSIIEVYLEASGSHTHSPAFFVFISEVLTIVAGIGLIICLLYNVNSFYRLYPHFLWIIVMFDFVAIAFSFGNWRYLNMNSYARMFESESMVFCEGYYEYYNILWDRHPNSRDPEPRLWANLEATLRCCGFNGVEDWATVCNGRVPLSCCRQNSLNDCHRELKSWNSGRHTLAAGNITSIRHLLYQKSCLNVLTLEAHSIQRDWIVIPLIVALFDLILMINGNHKTREITFKLQYSHGHKELANFRRHCWNKLKCKSLKVSPALVKENEDIDLGSNNLNNPYDPEDIGFVTDRESLEGVVLSKTEIPTNEASLVTVEMIPIRNLQPFNKDKQN